MIIFGIEQQKKLVVPNMPNVECYTADNCMIANDCNKEHLDSLHFWLGTTFNRFA